MPIECFHFSLSLPAVQNPSPGTISWLLSFYLSFFLFLSSHPRYEHLYIYLYIYLFIHPYDYCQFQFFFVEGCFTVVLLNLTKIISCIDTLADGRWPPSHSKLPLTPTFPPHSLQV